MQNSNANGNGQRVYPAIIADLASGEVVAHRVSATAGVELALDLIAQAIKRIGRNRLNGAMIHYDQAFHYTRPQYIRTLADLGTAQSMSRKGNGLGNAPVESFCGHMEDEFDLVQYHSLDQVRSAIDEHVYNSNHLCYQWEREMMAPVEYRNHLLVGYMAVTALNIMRLMRAIA